MEFRCRLPLTATDFTVTPLSVKQPLVTAALLLSANLMIVLYSIPGEKPRSLAIQNNEKKNKKALSGSKTDDPSIEVG